MNRAIELKKIRRSHAQPLSGKSVALIFEKPSTRTRVSFEVAVRELGGHPLILRADELQLGRGETVEDTGAVLSRYVDAIAIRTFGHDRLEQLAEASSVPVINMLSDTEHPCQALADVMTVLERFSNPMDLKVSYLGDGNNVCHSLLLAGAKAGFGQMCVGCPPGFEPIEPVVELARSITSATGGSIQITHDADEAAAGAHVLYTDVWTSMGQEEESKARRLAFAGYEVTQGRMKLASEDAIVMHCLPAHRGEEIEAEVIDGSSSAVWDQAENRLHAQKALLEWLCQA